MSADLDRQWRIGNAAELKGQRLQFRRWTPRSESRNHNHDHCIACFATISAVDAANVHHDAYAARADYKDDGSGYQWVCPACFEDLKDDMQWTAVQ